MKKIQIIIILLIFKVLSVNTQAQTDVENCQDHPFFTRMSNFYIYECEKKDFEKYDFVTGFDSEGNPQTQKIEGKYTFLHYSIQEGKPNVSNLQIIKNYANAIQKLGGKSFIQNTEGLGNVFLTATFKKGSSEAWIAIPYLYNSGEVSEYHLVIIEREAMKQEITAKDILNALNEQGFLALYLNFDSGKSALKAEDQNTIAQIVDMLQTNPTLKISIEGHTDNVGTPEANKTLSEARAKAVYEALLTKGIEKSRLKYLGWGQEKPLADNRTENGKAQNRRVEIVKF
jgi:outer membrane protein OmpA-like peptidoglycan-associated protein